MLEDAKGLGFDEEGFDGGAEGFKGDFPVNFIADDDAAFSFFEGVAMMPKTIRSKALFVYE